MATFTLKRPDIFPSGTVKVWPIANAHLNASGPQVLPGGTATAEAEVSSGALTWTGLTAGEKYVAAAEVSSEIRIVEFAVPSATAIGTRSSTFLPSDNGLLAWTFDPVVASGTKILETAGTLHVEKLILPEATTVTNILTYLTTAGETLTASQNFAALYTGAGALARATAAAATITAWTATAGLKTLALSSPVAMEAGACYVAMYYNGTTAPTFATATSTLSGAINAGTEAATSRCFTADTGKTTAMPATLGTKTAVGQPFWIALS